MDPVRTSCDWSPRWRRRFDRLLLVGCRAPDPVEDADDIQAGLSGPVRSAVDEAIPLILSLARRLLGGEEFGAGIREL